MITEVYGTTIIEDTGNRFYKVRETGDAKLAHVWFGYEMKRNSKRRETISGVAWVPVPNARTVLVRKAATRVVEA